MITMKQLKERKKYLRLLISEISPKNDGKIKSFVTTLINERIDEIDGLIKDYDKVGKHK